MKVRDVMKHDPTTVDERDDVSLALQIMLWNDYRHLPVLRGTHLVGVLTERDVLASRRVDEPDAFRRMVGDVMTSPPATASPDDDLEDAAARMGEDRVGCLPVMEGDRLVGLLTVTDTLRALAELAGMSKTEAPHAPR